MPGPDPLLGTTVAGRYKVIKLLGEGGMGAVYLCRDTKLGRLVAIKVLLEHHGAGAGAFPGRGEGHGPLQA